ncbi:tannase/feruloyl esterase family alpha/beta hydrolase [Citricoccus muralis]|uniref:Tannase/feruloyl esterase family alpha/beta hydrolase n=1 Tax=Citricoccus muralis TaxID=169134 RepID=A0ABY8H6Z9_9MICC|nr:tannase/feruloyl esterase family alpha/beta hydrolase [Citricoccus muralis]WFP16925.1 tannase/feruloyl esterase family alpha/beta hydrolase [Citricoccus muralis]
MPFSARPRRLRRLLAAGLTGIISAAALSPAGATPTDNAPTSDLDCAALVEFEFENTTIEAVEAVAAGELSHRGSPVNAHCLVTGRMNERVSDVDGETYAIGFEMRLPHDWDGRYFYQANGGLDGAVTPALGAVGGSESALQLGMAVISSDAGHSGAQNPTFGLDPQARLDYGYQAVGTLTPMARQLIEDAYGEAPAYSYFGGGSNGGRHAMVAASRYAEDYDGFLAIAPGFNLPQAATAQIWGAQQWITVATDEADLSTALTTEERELLAGAILEQCDDLDGLADGMVQAQSDCQDTFSVSEHVPTCEADRDGTCLTDEQKAVVTTVFAGATTSTGDPIYSSFPYDPGLADANWADWKFNAPITRDSAALGYIFSSPPYAPELPQLRDFVFSVDIDEADSSLYASSEVYQESSMEFMTPPDLTYQDLAEQGGKMIVMHGASDGVFSMQDTADWYAQLEGAAAESIRYFEIPGMAHVRGGPSTDQHNSLAALISWVEEENRPEQLAAWVNPENASLPAEWSTERSRPLCAYPDVAYYVDGDVESADSFACAAEAPVDPEPSPTATAEPSPTDSAESTDPTDSASSDPTDDPTATPTPTEAPSTAPSDPGEPSATDPGADDVSASDRGDLAATGSSGALMMTALAVLLLVVGAAILILRRRRHGHHAG